MLASLFELGQTVASEGSSVDGSLHEVEYYIRNASMVSCLFCLGLVLHEPRTFEALGEDEKAITADAQDGIKPLLSLQAAGNYCEAPLLASPDGLVGTDRIVEVKCPLKYKEQEPLEAARNFSEKKRRDGAPVLSRSHTYFYQVQGHLRITRRIICDFVVYTTKGIHVQEVRRDDAFWRTQMEPFLLRFYKDCVLPEIVDSRLARSMAVRRPEWNRLAIEAKEKSKNGEASKAKRAKYKKD
ncbi:hypothetical protein MTO96_032502 [Rhipicephalus appendiculatus]